MRYRVQIDGQDFDVDLDDSTVQVDGRPVHVEWVERDGQPGGLLSVDGRTAAVRGERDAEGGWRLRVDGEPVRADVADERALRARQVAGAAGRAAGPRPVRAPMPGLVVRVDVQEGQTVEKGSGLVIVEAMKMENELKAEAPGVVARIRVSAGQTVEKDQVLIEMAPVEAA
ncbi:MAG: biotin/lipoyl-containing protein [Gemmatimonadota bacterium]